MLIVELHMNSVLTWFKIRATGYININKDILFMLQYVLQLVCLCVFVRTTVPKSSHIPSNQLTHPFVHYSITTFHASIHLFIYPLHTCEAWWLIGRFDTFRPNGCGFESRSSRHVGTLGKSFTRSCLWRFSLKLRHSIRAVSVASLSSSGLEEAL